MWPFHKVCISLRLHYFILYKSPITSSRPCDPCLPDGPLACSLTAVEIARVDLLSSPMALPTGEHYSSWSVACASPAASTATPSSSACRLVEQQAAHACSVSLLSCTDLKKLRS